MGYLLLNQRVVPPPSWLIWQLYTANISHMDISDP